MPWSARFNDPIILPGGRKLRTLLDAATHMTGLSKAEHDTNEWQIAMETLLLVAEGDGPMAQIAAMKALNRHNANAVPAPRRKRVAIAVCQGGRQAGPVSCMLF